MRRSKYRIEYTDPNAEAYTKILRVIESCYLPKQLTTAARMIILYEQKFKCGTGSVRVQMLTEALGWRTEEIDEQTNKINIHK